MFDESEPLRLVREMCEAGWAVVQLCRGILFHLPAGDETFDTSSMGIPTPDEHPLESVARLFEFTRKIQKAAGGVPWWATVMLGCASSSLCRGRQTCRQFLQALWDLAGPASPTHRRPGIFF